MRFEAIVYFAGPKTIWAEKIDETEIIARFHAPWLWLARLQARGALGNTGRCGYAILRDGTVAEEVAATNSAVIPL